MSNAWLRLYAEFSTDAKVQMMSEAMQRRLIMLFCFRCNSDVTLQDDEVTFLLRVTETEWRETKALFIAKGFIDADNSVLNWDKRQFRSDSSAERVSRHREKKKRDCNVTVTPPDTDTDTEKKESKGRGSRFALQDPPGDWIDYCVTNRPDLDPGGTFDYFRDYWIAKPGKDGIKLDWTATWRNWVRNQKQGGKNGTGIQQLNKADRAKAAIFSGLEEYRNSIRKD